MRGAAAEALQLLQLPGAYTCDGHVEGPLGPPFLRQLLQLLLPLQLLLQLQQLLRQLSCSSNFLFRPIGGSAKELV